MTQQQSRFLPAKIPSLILATSRPEPTAARAALRIFTIDECSIHKLSRRKSFNVPKARRHLNALLFTSNIDVKLA